MKIGLCITKLQTQVYYFCNGPRIRILGCEVQIENSVTRVTVRHHEARIHSISCILVLRRLWLSLDSRYVINLVSRDIVFARVVCPFVRPSVARPSVRLSVTKPYPLCNLKTVQDIFMKLHININRHWTTWTITLGYIVFSYEPLNFVSSSFCDKIVSAL